MTKFISSRICHLLDLTIALPYLIITAAIALLVV